MEPKNIPNSHDTPKLRALNCRRCGVEGETPGATYCDSCRPERLSDALMSPHDWARQSQLDELGPAQ